METALVLPSPAVLVAVSSALSRTHESEPVTIPSDAGGDCCLGALHLLQRMAEAGGASLRHCLRHLAATTPLAAATSLGQCCVDAGSWRARRVEGGGASSTIIVRRPTAVGIDIDVVYGT